MNGVTFGTDTEAIVPRLTPWMCHSRGISGFLQWSMDYNWKYGTFAKTAMSGCFTHPQTSRFIPCVSNTSVTGSRIST